jgi:hypothetical protein
MSEPPWQLVELDPVKRRAAGSPKKDEEKEETLTKQKASGFLSGPVPRRDPLTAHMVSR